MYSLDDGKTWRHSIGGGISQSVRYIGAIGKGDGLHFGIAGQHGKSQGVALTNNVRLMLSLSHALSPTLSLSLPLLRTLSQPRARAFSRTCTCCFSLANVHMLLFTCQCITNGGNRDDACFSNRICMCAHHIVF